MDRKTCLIPINLKEDKFTIFNFRSAYEYFIIRKNLTCMSQAISTTIWILPGTVNYRVEYQLLFRKRAYADLYQSSSWIWDYLVVNKFMLFTTETCAKDSQPKKTDTPCWEKCLGYNFPWWKLPKQTLQNGPGSCLYTIAVTPKYRPCRPWRLSTFFWTLD